MIHFVYNPDIKDATLGNYMLDAAKRRGVPVSWSRRGVPEGLKPSLIIKVDDGDIDAENYSKKYDCPTAWWFTDPHTDFNRGYQIAKNFDYVFCAQQPGNLELRERGINSAWLPVGCDPVYHSSLYEKLEDRPFDVGFSGSVGDSGGWNPSRPELLTEVSGRFKNSIISESTKGGNSFINNSSKVIFNQALNNDLNMRFFEAISSGAVLVTPKLIDNGLDYLPVSDSVFFYESKEEAMEQIKFALINIKGLNDHAEALASYYHEHHSYDSRLVSIHEHISNNSLEEDKPSEKKTTKS